MVTEYLDGMDLAQHLAVSGALTPDEVVLLVNPLCGALEQLRTRGLRVRALDPEHVFLSGGLAAFSPKLAGVGLTDFPTERAEAVDPREDVRALGELMHWAFVGERLPRGQEPFPASAKPTSSAWLEAVIKRCVAENPEARFGSPIEVAQALQGYVPGALAPGVTPPLLLTEENARERVGDVLGNYQLMRLLGEGAMGRVFFARHVKLGRPVALKVLRAEHTRNSGLIQRFFQEAKAVNQVNQENIVEIDDFVEEVGPGGHKRVYCVMELLEGENLTGVMASGPLPIHRAVRLVRQVCRALAAAHEVGVIHRDIKPDNLLVLDRPGRPDFVKVLDFGVAKLIIPFGETPLTSTVEGAIVGTPAYMSPEQASGSDADGRSDLYAVGTVLYEMLCGHPPFQGPTFGQLVAQVIAYPPPPLPTVTPRGEPIPAALRAVVLKCLEKDREARFSGMRELDDALAPYAKPDGERGAGLGTSGMKRWARQGAAAVALLVAGGWALYARSVPPSFPPPQGLALTALRPSGLSPRPDVTPGAVSVQVRSTPTGARVTRADTGEVLGLTPLTRSLGRPGGPVVLRVELAGHETLEKSVPLASNVALDVALEPARHRALGSHPVAKRGSERFSRDAVVDPFAL